MSKLIHPGDIEFHINQVWYYKIGEFFMKINKIELGVEFDSLRCISNQLIYGQFGDSILGPWNNSMSNNAFNITDRSLNKEWTFIDGVCNPIYSIWLDLERRLKLNKFETNINGNI